MHTPVLTLRICAKGFAKLATGQIGSKYRPATPYWQKRLFDADGKPKSFTAVHIKNGYRTNAPCAVFAFKAVSSQLYKHEDQLCYRIELGELLELQNSK